MPQFPVPDGETEESLAAQGDLRAAWTAGSRTACPTTHRDAGRVRAGRHRRRWASRPTSSSSPTSCSYAQAQRASGSAPAVARPPARSSPTRWASPTSTRSQHGLIFERFLNPERISHARHRHRLRRAPARRDDPLRHREVGRGPGRPDHHLRHDQGQGRDQGLGPGAGLPVRGRRPDHQGDAAGRDGQGHPARRHLRPDPPALRRGRRVPRAVRGRPGRREGRRHRPRARGPDPPARRARGRRDPVRASRCSTSSRSGAASRTARSSRSSTTRPARPSACSRWTSSACAT